MSQTFQANQQILIEFVPSNAQSFDSQRNKLNFFDILLKFEKSIRWSWRRRILKGLHFEDSSKSFRNAGYSVYLSYHLQPVVGIQKAPSSSNNIFFKCIQIIYRINSVNQKSKVPLAYCWVFLSMSVAFN